MKLHTNVKSGRGTSLNHNQSGLRVKSGVKAGGLTTNHNQSGLRVKSGVKAGGTLVNHNQSSARIKALRVRTGLKAGLLSWSFGASNPNHNQSIAARKSASR